MSPAKVDVAAMLLMLQRRLSQISQTCCFCRCWGLYCRYQTNVASRWGWMLPHRYKTKRVPSRYAIVVTVVETGG
jgi:hypothetical protein